MSMPKYSVLTDSGVDWLGQVPKHWRIKRLRFVSRLNPSKLELSSLDRGTLVSFIPMQDVGDDGTLNLEQDRPLESVEQGYTYFRDGDVTVAKITPCFENGKGALMTGLTNGVGFGTTELIVARPCIGEVTSKYLHYLFVSVPFRRIGESSMYGAGGQKRVPDDFVRDFKSVFPPVSEQEIITSFLDQETSKIDALISEQRRLIEILKEKRQAVISHAVTKGLNPDVRMKPSGVEWLGEVPEHWEVLKGGLLGALFGSEPIPEDAIGEDGEVAFVKVSSMSADGFEIESWDWFVDSNYFRKRQPMSNFLVFPKRGAAIFLNKVNIVERPAVLDPNLMGWKLNSLAHPKFIAYALRSRRLEEIADVSTVPQINNKHIAPQKFGIPPMEEQVDIVRYLDETTSQINALVHDIEHAIALLQERRTALISAAVTGKIDVRNYASTQKDAA